MPIYEKITGVILAGGKNSRMGSEKGLLLVEGKTMVERIIEVLKPWVSEIIIIHNGKHYMHLGYQVYSDLIPDCGPMGGIFTALTKSSNRKNLILSCDMPFISQKLLELILENSGNCDIAIPQHRKKVEPLCAIYDKVCQPKFGELLNRKELKLMEALKLFKVRQITIPQDILKTGPFTNINTPEDYLKISQLKN